MTEQTKAERLADALEAYWGAEFDRQRGRRSEMSEYTISEPPKYVGGYQIGGPRGLQINLKQKPNWLHRKMMRLCFGWEWVDMI
jgi:hypothetical protein